MGCFPACRIEEHFMALYSLSVFLFSGIDKGRQTVVDQDPADEPSTTTNPKLRSFRIFHFESRMRI